MSYRVLVVDDSEIVRNIIKKAINMSGVEIQTIFEACNGKEALAVLDKEWIDIVFTDLNMPEMTGFELVENMKNGDLLSDIPVVVVSSEQSTLKIEELLSSGVREYIKKPFRPEIFRDIFSRLLGGKK
ncbi:response regulator [Myxococcota bacterium]|nr:response regulator [Myxococcota bacterium]MBU1379648.1 response regulator [Myxococcota bacterium]MBU1497995.1 response regulator [Myxococcota bacterium]